MVAAREQDKTPFPSGAVLDWEAWDGTLPPPEVLQQYEEMMPGGARRLLEMMERERAYRWKRAAAAQEQELELLRLAAEGQDDDYEARIAYFTLVAAAVILLASTAGSIYLIAINHGWPGLGLAAAGAASAVTFLAGGSRFRLFRRRRGNRGAKSA